MVALVSTSTYTRVSTTPARGEVPTPSRPRRAFAPVWWAVLGIMVLSIGLECWAVTHDLPYPGVDEPVFVEPAVHMAATGDLNPHWFGHPGSTVIYPLAGLVHAWDALAHHGPILTSNAALTTRIQRSPTTFYV